LKIPGVKACVQAIACHERVVGAALNHLAVVQGKDQVGALSACRAVGAAEPRWVADRQCVE
jgi:hypothetical protein